MGFDPKLILAKQGWSEGRGLGKNNQGEKDPIKVTYKFDKTGLGHDFGKKYDVHSTFSLSFDNAVKKLKVVPTEDGGVKLESTSDAPEVKLSKEKTIGNFLKSNRLNNGELANVQDSNSSDDDSDSDAKSLPAIAKMTDEDLFLVCGGMTGHKAAKFGINLSAKLARIKEQDELASKVSKKESKSVNTQGTNVKLDVIQAETEINGHPIKSKKNKKAKNNQEENCSESLPSKVTFEKPVNVECEENTKKRKSKKVESLDTENNSSENNFVTKKKKKSKQCDESEECIVIEKIEKVENSKIEKSKKKKKSQDASKMELQKENENSTKKRKRSDSEELVEASYSVEVANSKVKTKKKSRIEKDNELEEKETIEQVDGSDSVKRKKKNKKDKKNS